MGYDRQEPRARIIFVLAIGFAAFVVASDIAIRAYFHRETDQEVKEKVLDTPNVEWTAMRDAAQKRLGTYGWVDAKAQVAHIPIDRAMQLVLNDVKAANAAGVEAPPATKATAKPAKAEPKKTEPKKKGK